MKLLSGSVIGPCNKPIYTRTTLYVFRIHATRLYKHVFKPCSARPSATRCDIVEVTVRRSQDTVL